MGCSYLAQLQPAVGRRGLVSDKGDAVEARNVSRHVEGNRDFDVLAVISLDEFPTGTGLRDDLRESWRGILECRDRRERLRRLLSRQVP